MPITLDEIELLRDALGSAASAREAAVRRMKPGFGQHHIERAEAMRELCRKLHNLQCWLTDDDTIDIGDLPQCDRDEIATDVARRRTATGSVARKVPA